MDPIPTILFQFPHNAPEFFIDPIYKKALLLDKTILRLKHANGSIDLTFQPAESLTDLQNMITAFKDQTGTDISYLFSLTSTCKDIKQFASDGTKALSTLPVTHPFSAITILHYMFCIVKEYIPGTKYTYNCD